MRSIVKAAIGSLLLLALYIWAYRLAVNPKHPHCGSTTKWLLMQPPLSPKGLGTSNDHHIPLWKWQIASCHNSAADCNSYRLQRNEAFSEDLKNYPSGQDKTLDDFNNGTTEQFVAARCMSVNDPELGEAVRSHGPFVPPSYGVDGIDE